MGDKKKKNRENNHEWEELCFMLLSYLSKTVAAYKTTDWEIHFEDKSLLWYFHCLSNTILYYIL